MGYYKKITIPYLYIHFYFRMIIVLAVLAHAIRIVTSNEIPLESEPILEPSLQLIHKLTTYPSIETPSLNSSIDLWIRIDKDIEFKPVSYPTPQQAENLMPYV